MIPHRPVIAAGPGEVRRLCCGAAGPVGVAAADALADMDDPVTLLDGQPVAVPELWSAVLRAALGCPDRAHNPAAVLIIHPSWWSTRRVDLLCAAACGLADNVLTRSRAECFGAGAPDSQTGLVVEIADRLVAVTAAETVAEPRIGHPGVVAAAVARRVVAAAGRVGAASGGGGAAVLIDRPGGVGGATVLAAMITEQLHAVLPDATVELVDDVSLVGSADPGGAADTADPGRLTRAAVAGGATATRAWSSAAPGRRVAARALAAAAVVLSAAIVGTGAWHRSGVPADMPAELPPMAFLVEGRVAVQVPAQWLVRRVVGGPGSARLEVVSPADSLVMLHVTQALVPDGTPGATAATLESALDQANDSADAQVAGHAAAPVFVDFNAAGSSAGRAAVTYSEIRADHRVDWTVLVDGPVRIAIGCQSSPAGADAVRAVCDQAVRSARALH